MSRMEYEVLIRVDTSGSSPVLVQEGESVPVCDGTRYSLYGRTDDREEALRMLEAARSVRLQL